jgi:hypothetical protein
MLVHARGDPGWRVVTTLYRVYRLSLERPANRHISQVSSRMSTPQGSGFLSSWGPQPLLRDDLVSCLNLVRRRATSSKGRLGCLRPKRELR